MRDHDLLVVGSAGADLMVGVERRPGPGETVLGTALAVHPGGRGANQAVAAARLGARTALLARVGDDGHGRMLLESQRAAGVDIEGVQVGGAPTGVALITVDPSGDNSVVSFPGANRRLSPADVRAARELVRTARVVSVQLEIPLDTVAEIVRTLSPGSRFMLTATPPAALPAEVLSACDPLIVNEHEARTLLGTGAGLEPRDWALGLLSRGPRAVVLTLGAAGAMVADGRSRTCALVPGPRAGDAFTAALGWRLGLGEDLATATSYAMRAGAARP
ncbi:ribokinase [Streptomyces sp. NPDC051018]|uniref:ribokinase n=1 Tax=Streptomyces sp. NPDC051018 TaxID=3365639 RepID=UPI0037A74BAD